MLEVLVVGYVVAVCSALVMGFLAGLLLFKRSDEWRRWCHCGVTKACPLGHAEGGSPGPTAVPR